MSENQNLEENTENSPQKADSKNLEFLNNLLKSNPNSNPEPNESINQINTNQSNDFSLIPLNNSEKP